MRARRVSGPTRSLTMLDLVMLALTFGFFAVGVVYVLGCERL